MTPIERGNLAEKNFESGYNCSQAIALAFSDILPYSKEELSKMVCSFGGGISRLRETCGVVTTIAFIMGIIYGYETPEEGAVKMEQYSRVQEVIKRFENKFGSLSCGSLLNIKGHEEPKPTPRTPSFYKVRPCGKFINYGAYILQEYLDNDH